MYCKKCGSTLKEGIRFCESCGAQADEQGAATMPALPIVNDPPEISPTGNASPAGNGSPAGDVPPDAPPPPPSPAMPSYAAPSAAPPASYSPPYGASSSYAPPAYNNNTSGVYTPPAPPPSQPSYSGGYRPANPVYSGDDASPLSMGSYLGYLFLFSIPFLIGFIIQLVFAFGQGNVNRKNFARAYLLYQVIMIGISVVLMICFYGVLFAMADSIGGFF